MNGFYKDVVLLDQPSVSDSKKTVKALLDEAGVTVTRFVRFEVGQSCACRATVAFMPFATTRSAISTRSAWPSASGPATSRGRRWSTPRSPVPRR